MLPLRMRLIGLVRGHCCKCLQVALHSFLCLSQDGETHCLLGAGPIVVSDTLIVLAFLNECFFIHDLSNKQLHSLHPSSAENWKQENCLCGWGTTPADVLCLVKPLSTALYSMHLRSLSKVRANLFLFHTGFVWMPCYD